MSYKNKYKLNKEHDKNIQARTFNMEKDSPFLHYQTDDLLFRELNVICSYSDEIDIGTPCHLYVLKSDFRDFRQIFSKKIGVDEKTVSNHLKHLIEKKMVIEFSTIYNGQRKKCLGIPDVPEDITSITIPLAKIKNFPLQEKHSFRIYLYLLNKYRNNEINFTYKEIASAMGYEATNRGTTTDKISIVLQKLQQEKIMEWTEFYRMYNNHPIPYKKILSADLSEVRTKNFKKEMVEKAKAQDNNKEEEENKKIQPKLTKGFYLYKYEDINKEIVYIGQTTSLAQRVRQHTHDKLQKFFGTIYYVKCGSKEEMDFLEKVLINYYKPKFNIIHKERKDLMVNLINLDLNWQFYKEV